MTWLARIPLGDYIKVQGAVADWHPIFPDLSTVSSVVVAYRLILEQNGSKELRVDDCNVIQVVKRQVELRRVLDEIWQALTPSLQNQASSFSIDPGATGDPTLRKVGLCVTETGEGGRQTPCSILFSSYVRIYHVQGRHSLRRKCILPHEWFDALRSILSDGWNFLRRRITPATLVVLSVTGILLALWGFGSIEKGVHPVIGAIIMLAGSTMTGSSLGMLIPYKRGASTRTTVHRYLRWCISTTIALLVGDVFFSWLITGSIIPISVVVSITAVIGVLILIFFLLDQ